MHAYSEGLCNEHRYREVVQQPKGFWLHPAVEWRSRRFVHISAVERAGMSTLSEGQQVSFDVVADRRSGKAAAENLRAA